MTEDERDIRQTIASAHRIVIKLGTRVLSDSKGRLNKARVSEVVAALSKLHKEKEIIIVTSGAVGSGMEVLNLKSRPKDLSGLQMAAAVGQPKLMSCYSECFSKYKISVGQVLLTHDDLKIRGRHLTVRNTLLSLLKNKLIPIINENDAVSVDEIKIGDNDTLAALVSILIGADVLLLLTTVNGLQNNQTKSANKRVSYLNEVTSTALSLANGKGSELSVGGMATKLQAAEMVTKVGGLCIIADGRRKDTLPRIFAGEEVGTAIGSTKLNSRSITNSRKKWIAFFNKHRGIVTIDRGAEEALVKKDRSLLSVGVQRVDGNFDIGDLVEIRSIDGVLLGKGLAGYSSSQLELVRGKKTKDAELISSGNCYKEVIHRDNLVLLVKD
jgi:glutamate 5-kinase